MKTSEWLREPRLAWEVWQELHKLADLLWEHYEDYFFDWVGEDEESCLEEDVDPAVDLEEEIEKVF
jgi:hypothetical protein